MFATEREVLPEIQTPFTEKHPPESWMPLANVEVAVAPVTLRYEVCTPAPNVEVAAPKIEVVAAEPTYKPPYAERSEEEAFVTESLLVDELKVKFADALNEPLSLNCTCVSEPPGVPEPPLPVIQVPSTAKHPSARSMPFANVDVPAPVTESEPTLALLAVKVVAATLEFEIEPPVNVEFEISTLLSWSILFVSAMVFVKPPEAGGDETLVIAYICEVSLLSS